MISILRPAVLLGAILALAGCVAPRPVLDTAGADPDLTPGAVRARPSASVGEQVIWGGGIIATENLASGSRLELMTYPLDADLRPDRGAEPRGRVLVVHDGYLEPLDFRQGRPVTVRGTVVDITTATIGERRERYPVVRADALHLWPPAPDRREGLPFSVHFGIFVHN